MAILSQRPLRRRHALRAWMAAIAISLPTAAAAQYDTPELGSTLPPAEQYHFEVSGNLWNPNVSGTIASQRLGILGSRVDFIDDLGFERTQFKDVRFVLRPSKKSRFRIQYTPIEYTAETNLRRDLTFNGQKFPLNLPIQSEFDWKVWRFGYEYDFLYRDWGFVGALIEGRYTRMTAELASPIQTEFTKVEAPLPAFGIVGRVYPIPEVALNFEMTMFRVPAETFPDVEANYYDWDIHGTVNLHRSVGLQLGWRRMTNFLTVEDDSADVKFQGLWFGAALRY